MAAINYLDFMHGQLFRIIMEKHFKSQVHKYKGTGKSIDLTTQHFNQSTRNIPFITYHKSTREPISPRVLNT